MGITGLLVILDKQFLQVLEGPGSELNTLYEKIIRDSRHKNPKLISYTAIHDRHFKAVDCTYI
ncbi:MAG: BLUF domain-containing protein [Candidatus Competibacteraceae bacterium]|nr:BLUF domain-containing protein [Candidatus Competibacteraceae bacterium]